MKLLLSIFLFYHLVSFAATSNSEEQKAVAPKVYTIILQIIIHNFKKFKVIFYS